MSGYSIDFSAKIALKMMPLGQLLCTTLSCKVIKNVKAVTIVLCTRPNKDLHDGVRWWP